jgi:hypothetical protein
MTELTMNKGELIGKIVRLQVQKVPIKIKGEAYLPHEILSVESASVDAWGMLGFHDGTWVVDAHHRSHPAARGGGRRPLSVGFTGHYDKMAERFGSAPIGIAGENIIIDGPAFALADLGEGLIVKTASGSVMSLERPRVAAPCVEFTSFMLGLEGVAPRDEIDGPLADLHDGRRGFIVAADRHPTAEVLTVGDEVFLAS